MEFKYKTKDEIRCKVIMLGKSMTWLAQQLNFSTTYLYRTIKDESEVILNAINGVLEREEKSDKDGE